MFGCSESPFCGLQGQGLCAITAHILQQPEQEATVHPSTGTRIPSNLHPTAGAWEEQPRCRAKGFGGKRGEAGRSWADQIAE